VEKNKMSLPFNAIDKLKPIKFHPYTSFVKDRFYECDFSSHFNEAVNMDEYLSTESELIEKFTDAGIKCGRDNKIVFECEMNGVRICFGFYDWVFSIGLSYFDEREGE
jgi:hypothetical protein